MQEEHAGWGQRVAGRIFGVSPAVLLGVFLCSLAVGPGFREDEVSCEEAVTHLDECCPDFDETLMNCTYGGDCSSVSTDFTAAESQCIRDASCEEIRERDLCSIRPHYVQQQRTLDKEAVCP